MLATGLLRRDPGFATAPANLSSAQEHIPVFLDAKRPFRECSFHVGSPLFDVETTLLLIRSDELEAYLWLR